MNEEMLQDDVTESVDDTQVEDSQEVAESQEVAPKNDDFVEFSTPEQLKRVNKLTWEKNEAIRREKAKDEKNRQLEERLAALESSSPKPAESSVSEIQPPNADLQYSDPEAYTKQLTDWQSNVLKAAQAEAQRTTQSLLNETKTASEQAAQQAQQREILQQYQERAISSGIDMQKLIDAGNVVDAYQPNPEVINFLFDDPNGPHLVNYLANNQTELEKLVSMPPMRAALHLNGLREKALNANQGTKAPDPLEPLGGRGTVEDESPYLKGATFS